MRSWMHVVLALVAILGMAATSQAATDLSSMAPPETEALQKRLTDDGCFKGAVDGSKSNALEQAVKICPDQAPMLRIETGMHIAPIFSIDVDRQCDLLASGSADKTIRLWSPMTGALYRTIRLPIEDGNGSGITGLAISPDGHWLAIGFVEGTETLDRHSNGELYLVDLDSNRLKRIRGFDQSISQIAFSADGRRIGVGLNFGGVRVIDRASGQELMADRGSFGIGHIQLAFAADGSLFTTMDEWFVRRYGSDLKFTAVSGKPGERSPSEIAVSPDGSKIAVSYFDEKTLEILDAHSLSVRSNAIMDGLASNNFIEVAWLANGLLAAGGWTGDRGEIRLFEPNGQRRSPNLLTSSGSITGIRACQGGLVFATSDPRFGLVNSDTSITILRDPVTADLRNAIGDSFLISADAGQVRLDLDTVSGRSLLVDLGTSVGSTSTGNYNELHAAKVDSLSISDWKNSKVPALKGRPLEGWSEFSEISHALAIQPDQTGFVLGTDRALRAFDAAGRSRWALEYRGNVWGVNTSDDGRIIVAAYGDGTIQWHRWSDGKQILSLFVDAVTRKWVAWTPTGYYVASPGGEDLIGWQVNRGWEQEADFFPVSRFRDKFNRPDVVRLVLKTLDEGEALKQADVVSRRHEDDRPLIQRLPPVIKILSPAAGASVPPGLVEVRYDVRLPSGGGLARVEAFVDGAKVEPRGLARPGEGAALDTSGTVTLPMPARDASLSLVAYGADGKASDAAVLTLKSAAPAPAAGELKPSLYALLVGVSHYQDKSYDLGYAAADARGFAEALKAQEGRLYAHVEVKVLVDGDATAVGLKRGLSWLRRQTTAHDLALVFAAGHGTTDAKGRFWFLPTDMDPSDIDATAVSQDEIAGALYDLPGKKLLFLDACHSGAALNEGARGTTDLSAAINDFAQAEGGVVAYAASTGREFSLERPAWGHGAFTKALIEGFGGQADLVHDGTITTGTLDLFVERRVKELTGGEQHAVMTRPKTVPDFPIAIVGR